MINTKKKLSLMKWIWSSFLKTALIPLVVIELAFIGIYFLTSEWSKNETVKMLKKTVQAELSQLSVQETTVIQNKISSVSNSLKVYQDQIKFALDNPDYTPDREDLNRLSYSVPSLPLCRYSVMIGLYFCRRIYKERAVSFVDYSIIDNKADGS